MSQLKLLTNFALFLAICVSCTMRETMASLSEDVMSHQKVEVEFSIGEDAAFETLTKSTTAASEGVINQFQILVFNPSGALVTYGKSSDGKSISIKVNRTANQTCYAIVNSSEDLSSVGKLSDLTAKISYLKNNSSSGLEMIGSVVKDFTSATTCTIDVKRFAAKVVIDKISTSMYSPAHSASGFVLKGIYLTNVNGSCPYSLTPTDGSLWYNKLAYKSGEEVEGLISEASLNVTIKDSSPYSTPHYFYCYSNPATSDATGGTFSARFTRLVITGQILGQTYYYPINIIDKNNALNSNCSYEVTNLTITGPGSDSPEIIPKKGSVSFSVKVTDWGTGFSKEIEY